MKQSRQVLSKIYDHDGLKRQLNIWKLQGKSVVFTNGVFDILHQGHVCLLSEAAALADVMVVGVNSDASVKRLKGESRPINDQHSRALLLAAMVMVDGVIIFEQDTPLELVKMILPAVLVKGGDYTVDQIAGAQETAINGGKVKIIPIVKGFSTTSILKKSQNK